MIFGMTISELLRLLLPPVFFKIWRKIYPKPVPQIVPMPLLEGHSDTMVVIGNGPSLKDSLEKYSDNIIKYDRIAVNYFAATDAFEKIKPNFYAFADPMWFGGKQEFKEGVDSLLKTLLQKTTWDMTIILPQMAQSMPISKLLLTNAHIKLAFYYDGYYTPKGMAYFDALDNNFVDPPGQTVLNICVWFAIYQSYKETYIIGADTSFFRDIKVDQQTNILYTIDQHFYDNNEVYKDTGLFDANHCRKMSLTITKLFEDVGGMFRDYEVLSQYARWKGVKLYNASEYSWVDSLERKKLGS